MWLGVLCFGAPVHIPTTWAMHVLDACWWGRPRRPLMTMPSRGPSEPWTSAGDLCPEPGVSSNSNWCNASSRLATLVVTLGCAIELGVDAARKPHINPGAGYAGVRKAGHAVSSHVHFPSSPAVRGRSLAPIIGRRTHFRGPCPRRSPSPRVTVGCVAMGSKQSCSWKV